MTTQNVLFRNRPPSTNNLRDALALALYEAQGAKSDPDTADALGISVGTVKNIRNRANTASLETLSAMAFHTGGAALLPWLATIGGRFVPLSAFCTTDAGVQTELARVALKVAMALNPASPGGSELTPAEAVDMMPDVGRLQAHLDRIRALAVQVAA